MDVEAVHTMAPGVAIVHVGAPNSYQDLDAALDHVVDRHLAQIVTNSYGTMGYRTADRPASSPWVTAVGGTSLAIGADGSIVADPG